MAQGLILRALTILVCCRHLYAGFQSPWLNPNIRPDLYEICLVFPLDESSFHEFVKPCLAGFIFSETDSRSISRLQEKYGLGNNSNLESTSAITSPYLNDFIGNNKVGNLTYFGSVRIMLKVSDETSEIRFHANERISIVAHSNSFTNDNGNIEQDGEKYTLTFSESLPRNQPFYVEFVFKSHLTKQSCYMCGVTEMNWARDRDGDIFISTFLAARQLSPFLDEPSFKARHRLSAAIPSHMKILTNRQADSVSEIGQNNKGLFHQFEESLVVPPWGTIMVAGNFESECEWIHGIEWCVSGLIANVPGSKSGLIKEADRIIRFASKSYNLTKSWLIVEFEVFPRIQIVGVPSYMGAVSLPGFIIVGEYMFWQEDAFEELKTSIATLEKIPTGNLALSESRIVDLVDSLTSNLGTLAHELAHQWFACLVNHYWWNDIWLIESLATVIEFDTFDELDQYPVAHTGMFKKEKRRIGAMKQWLKAAERGMNVSDEIRDLFNTGVYIKGGSVLEMLKAMIGKDVFYEGLRLYLREYAYKAATTQDLLDAFQESVDKHNVFQYKDKEYKLLNVTDFLPTWIYSNGVPKVEAYLDKSGKAINFHQSAYLSEDSTLWNIPIMFTVLTANASNIFTFWLSERNASWINPLNDQFDYVFFHDSPGLAYPIFYDESLDPISRGFLDKKSNCALVSINQLFMYLVNRELPANLRAEIQMIDMKGNRVVEFMEASYGKFMINQLIGLAFTCEDMVDIYMTI